MRLLLFGEFQAICPRAQIISINSKKNRALLAVLGSSSQPMLSRDKAANLLWGDKGEELAKGALRQSLSVLRKELGAQSDIIILKDNQIGLNHELVRLDARQFVEFSSRDGDELALINALDIFKGQFLEDVGVLTDEFEQWLAWERQRVLQLAIATASRLCSLVAPGRRISAAQKLLSLDPLRESSHRIAMEAYWEAGETALAAQQYATCAKILKDEFGVVPSEKTQRLRNQIAVQRAISVGSAASDNLEEQLENSGQDSRLTVVVLPLRDLSQNLEYQFLAEGLSADISSALSKFRGLVVISANSAQTDKTRQIANSTNGNRIDSRFAVDGSLRRTANALRISIRLIETRTGQEIWGERYEFGLDQLPYTQDDIVRAIASTLEGRLASAVAGGSGWKGASSFKIYEQVLRARHLISTYSVNEAEKLLLDAVNREPNYAHAHSWLSMSRWLLFIDTLDDGFIRKSVENGKRAVEIDPDDSTCLAHYGLALLFSRQFELADVVTQKALERNLFDLLAIDVRANFLSRVGHATRAIELLQQARKFNPYPPSYYWESLAIAQLALGCYRECIATLQLMSRTYWWDDLYLAACHAGLGNLVEGQKHVLKAKEAKPDLNLHKFLLAEPFKRDKDAKAILDLLHEAGLQA